MIKNLYLKKNKQNNQETKRINDIYNTKHKDRCMDFIINSEN